MECINLVVVMHRKDGSPVRRNCGEQFAGEMALCDDCEKEALLTHPQGWRGYPGDTCKHGVYVGGCGADLMCPACEFGEDD